VVDHDDRGAALMIASPPGMTRVESTAHALGEELEVRLVAAEPAERRVAFEVPGA
jgi:hypothetical protein